MVVSFSLSIPENSFVVVEVSGKLVYLNETGGSIASGGESQLPSKASVVLLLPNGNMLVCKERDETGLGKIYEYGGEGDDVLRSSGDLSELESVTGKKEGRERERS